MTRHRSMDVRDNIKRRSEIRGECLIDSWNNILYGPYDPCFVGMMIKYGTQRLQHSLWSWKYCTFYSSYSFMILEISNSFWSYEWSWKHQKSCVSIIYDSGNIENHIFKVFLALGGISCGNGHYSTRYQPWYWIRAVALHRYYGPALALGTSPGTGYRRQLRRPNNLPPLNITPREQIPRLAEIPHFDKHGPRNEIYLGPAVNHIRIGVQHMYTQNSARRDRPLLAGLFSSYFEVVQCRSPSWSMRAERASKATSVFQAPTMHSYVESAWKLRNSKHLQNDCLHTESKASAKFDKAGFDKVAEVATIGWRSRD